jgi:hypothetical protein
MDFLRLVIGDQFFDDNTEYHITNFFQKRQVLKTHLEDARKALSSLSGRPLMEKVKELGRTDSLSLHKTDVDARNYIEDVVEHAGVLLALIEEKFKPIAERLALQLSYGDIAFDLLVYYFEKGKKYYSTSYGELAAFILTGAQYEFHHDSHHDPRHNQYANYHADVHRDSHHDSEPSSFTISGDGFLWDGFSYTKQHRRYSIAKYSGTKAITDLTCKTLTDDVRETLVARGRRYTALSGTHYKACNGRRIMVDRLTYDNRGTFQDSPSLCV